MNQDESEIIESELIAKKLIAAIKADKKIHSTSVLGPQAIEDDLFEMCRIILEAIDNNNPNLLNTYRQNWGSRHGLSRSAQDFEPEELVREFFLLKRIIIEELTSQLCKYSSQQVIEKLTLVDVVIGKVIEDSFESYEKLRKQELQDLNRQILLTNQEIARLIANGQENISYLIHEIKNPLTSIIGYSDLLIRYQKQQQNLVDNLSHIRQILQQGRNILRLLNDASEISAYERGNFQLHVRQVDICLLLEDVVVSLRSVIEAKRIQLITTCFPEKLEIRSDYLRLQQIINNLLSNAIRYTIKGKIEISCRQTEGNLLEIKVSDTGIGISQENCDRIFEPFFRTEDSTLNAPEGIGLGLAIVAQLVNILNGQIKLKSEVNVGSTFTVTIPLNNKFYS